MKPLKRFAQCGSITMLFAIFIVLFGVSSTALTTFGKTSNQPPPTQVPVALGRECNTHEDCSSLQHTSCVRAHGDDRTRCICGDNNAPINGECSSTKKSLYHVCKTDVECDEGMICEAPTPTSNKTTTVPTSQFLASSKKQKLCTCDENNNYKETYGICSGCQRTIKDFGLSIGLLGVIISISLHSMVHHQTSYPV